jgi:hypothetical protein
MLAARDKVEPDSPYDQQLDGGDTKILDVGNSFMVRLAKLPRMFCATIG